MTDEKWRPIRGYTHYEVSDQGRVRNTDTGELIKPNTDAHGFRKLKLYKNGIETGFRVHRLVAETFLEGFDPKRRLGFINNDKSDCRLENIRLTTQNCAAPKHARGK